MMPFRHEPFTDVTFDSSKCVICQSHSDEALSAVTDRGRPTLLNFCRTRQWLVLADILLNPATAAVFIHGSCRKHFTRLTTADSDKCDNNTSEFSPTKHLRSTDDSFDWKTCCFLCKEHVDFNLIAMVIAFVQII